MYLFCYISCSLYHVICPLHLTRPCIILTKYIHKSSRGEAAKIHTVYLYIYIYIYVSIKVHLVWQCLWLTGDEEKYFSKEKYIYMPLYLLIGSRYKFCFLKKMSLVWTKNIYFISKCFFKDRFIFVIQQFFVKKGPVPEKTSCSPPLLLVYYKSENDFLQSGPCSRGGKEQRGKIRNIPPPSRQMVSPPPSSLQTSFLLQQSWVGLGVKVQVGRQRGGKAEGFIKLVTVDYNEWQWQ